MRLSLRAGEKIYVNGAVLRVGNRTRIELLNDATFLLEAHVIQAEEATTPLRQLYFIAQTILIDPQGAADARSLFARNHAETLRVIEDRTLAQCIVPLAALVADGDVFDAMKRLRALFPFEDELVSNSSSIEAA